MIRLFQSKNSVGVSRQYCGVLGKVANCQSVVSWHFANDEVHFPLMAELYLPKSWTDEPKKLKASGVPIERFEFQEKWRLALSLLDRFKTLVPFDVVAMDAGYGEIKEYWRELDRQNIHFVAQIPESHGFWPIDVKLKTSQNKIGRPRLYPGVMDKKQKPLTAKEWAYALGDVRWKTVKLKLKSKKEIKVKAVRVRDLNHSAYYRPGKKMWLLIEQFEGGFKFYISNLPEDADIAYMAQVAHSRWKIEQGYQQLKEELGLDHFEGRSWLGLHHHITMCYLAYDFLVWLGVIKKSLDFITLPAVRRKLN